MNTLYKLEKMLSATISHITRVEQGEKHSSALGIERLEKEKDRLIKLISKARKSSH
jgi:hypothetical protein